MYVKAFAPLLLAAVGMCAAGSEVDIYSSKGLEQMAAALAAKGTPYADRSLARYPGHYFLLIRRNQTGSAELHQHESDVFVVQSGEATVLVGGKIVAPHLTKPGEIRGTSIDGGTRHALAPGDIINIPAGTPHQVLLEKDRAFSYFVVKIAGR